MSAMNAIKGCIEQHCNNELKNTCYGLLFNVNDLMRRNCDYIFYNYHLINYLDGRRE